MLLQRCRIFGRHASTLFRWSYQSPLRNMRWPPVCRQEPCCKFFRRALMPAQNLALASRAWLHSERHEHCEFVEAMVAPAANGSAHSQEGRQLWWSARTHDSLPCMRPIAGHVCVASQYQWCEGLNWFWQGRMPLSPQKLRGAPGIPGEGLRRHPQRQSPWKPRAQPSKESRRKENRRKKPRAEPRTKFFAWVWALCVPRGTSHQK